MAETIIKTKDYRSDIVLTMHMTLGGETVNVPQHDFLLRFFTENNARHYDCGRIKGEWLHCAPDASDATLLTCYIKNHGLGCGMLQCTYIDLSPNDGMEDGVQRTFSVSGIDLELVDDASDDTQAVSGAVAIDINAVLADLHDAADAAIASQQKNIASIVYLASDQPGGQNTITITLNDGTVISGTVLNGKGADDDYVKDVKLNGRSVVTNKGVALIVTEASQLPALVTIDGMRKENVLDALVALNQYISSVEESIDEHGGETELVFGSLNNGIFYDINGNEAVRSATLLYIDRNTGIIYRWGTNSFEQVGGKDLGEYSLKNVPFLENPDTSNPDVFNIYKTYEDYVAWLRDDSASRLMTVAELLAYLDANIGQYVLALDAASSPEYIQRLSVAGGIASQSSATSAVDLRSHDNAPGLKISFAIDRTATNTGTTLTAERSTGITTASYNGNTKVNEVSIAPAGVISKTASGVTKTFNLPAESGTLALQSEVAAKQDALVSGTNIKSINGQSVLGTGNMTIHEEQLIEKSYAPAEFSGLGRKYLQKNIVSDKNVLTQAMMNDANTIYVIQYDYDLNGASITVPSGCVLQFEGGSLSNGVIDLNGCTINADTKIFEDVVPTENSILVQDINPMWFGAKGDGVTDDTDAWEACIAFTKQIKPANLNTFRQYNRPQARISAPKHAHFKITRPLTITFQCDIIGGFRFDYYGAYPAENTGIINFYGTYSKCVYQFNIMYCQLTSSATGSFYPDWRNVPPFAGISIGSADNPTYMEECTFTVNVYKCQIGIRAYGHNGSKVITSPTFLNCGFYTCIIGVENYIHDENGSVAWNNCYKFYGCDFRPGTSGYQIPVSTERFAFCKVSGDGNYPMSASLIDGLELEGRPHNLPQSILWVDNGSDTSGLRISNVRTENIGYEFIVSNAPFTNSIIDNSRWSTNHLYVKIKGVTFYQRNTDIPGFTVINGQTDFTYNFIEKFDYYKMLRKSLVQPDGAGFKWYRLKHTFLCNRTYFGDTGKRSTSPSVDLAILYKVQDKGLIEITADVLKGGTYRVDILDKDTLSRTEIDTSKFITFGLNYNNVADGSATKIVGFYHNKGNITADQCVANSWIYNNTGDDVIIALYSIRPNHLLDIADSVYPIEIRGNDKVSIFSTDDYFNVEGALSDRPTNLLPSDDGFKFHDIYNDIIYTWNGQTWVYESGYSSNIKVGTTADRPSLSFGEDGYKFYDTTLGRNVYSLIDKEPVLGSNVPARVDASTASTVIIDNTLTGGQVYWLGYNSRHSYGGYVAFRKTADSSDRQLTVLPNFASYDLGVFFVAPSPSEYPYIFITSSLNSSNRITFYKPVTYWVDEDRFAAGARQGNTASRPQLNFGDDGCRYYDTDINRSIYSKVDKGTSIITETVAKQNNSTVSNTLTEGKKYWLGFSAKNTWSGSVRFRKTTDSSEGEIIVLYNLNNDDLGVFFIAPSPTDYPYIYMVNSWNSAETFTFQEPTTSWVEEDGATAGVARSGDTASRPASTDIYTGFQYWDTDLGKMIAWNGTAWVDSSSIKNISTIPATGLLPNVVYNYGTTDTVSVTLAAGEAGVANIWCFVFTAQTAACTVTLPSGVVLGNEYAWDMVAGRRYEVSIMDNVAIVNYSD